MQHAPTPHSEKDLDEVVQIQNVFLNVSKGQVAPNEDLQKAFGTSDTDQIVLEVSRTLLLRDGGLIVTETGRCSHLIRRSRPFRTCQILKKGELQVGEKERSHELSSLWRDIATQVAEKCVDPSTQRPYTVGMIEKAMSEVHFSVKPGKSAKLQSLDAIRAIQEKKVIPIERAKMRVRVTMPNKDGKKVKEKVVALVEKVEEEDWSEEWELVSIMSPSNADHSSVDDLAMQMLTRAKCAPQIATIDPGALRQINELLEAEIKGRGRVETLSFTSIGEGEGEERLE